MRHPELDISRAVQDRHAVDRNAVKTLGWITLVSNVLLDEVGGRKKVAAALSRSTECTAIGDGTMFRIGSSPTISDRERGETSPAYQALYAALRPLIERAGEQSPWFSTDSADQDAETRAWFRRFG